MPASLAGTPAISVPCGLAVDPGEPGGPLLPVGLQIMAPALRDDLCYRVAATFEAAYTTAHGPVLAQATPLAGVLDGAAK